MKKSVLLFCAAVAILVLLPSRSKADWTRSNGPWSATVMDILANGSNLFSATRGGGVFLSTDNGSSWTPLDNGLTNPYVNSLDVSGTSLFAGTTTLYGGIGGGVLRSTDNGATWTLTSSGIASTSVNSIAVSGSNLFAGTDRQNGNGGEIGRATGRE